MEGRLDALFAAKCAEFGVIPVAMGGTEDHVHLLLRIKPTTVLADVVKHLKGSSSLLASSAAPSSFSKWQGAYAAITVSPSGVDAVRDYVRRQKEHHAKGSVSADMEVDNELA